MHVDREEEDMNEHGLCNILVLVRRKAVNTDPLAEVDTNYCKTLKKAVMQPN